MSQIVLSEIFLYALFLAFIMIDEPILVIAYIIAVGAAIFYMRRKKKEKLAELERLYAENLPKAGLFMAVLALAFPFLVGGDTYWLQVINFAMMNAMMALGLNLMTGRAGLICLGYAAFEAIGAYTVGILTLKMGISFWVAFPLGGLFAFFVGILLGLPALRVKGHYLALVTIAFGLIVQEIALNAESITGGTNGLIDIPSPTLFSYDFSTPLDLGFISMSYLANFYYLILGVLVISVLAIYCLSNSFFGLSLNAMRDDQLAAQCYGMNLTRYKLYAFAIGAIFGGLAGGIYAGMINFIAPENFGYGLSIIIISMIILGGLDSIPGAIAGALFLTVFPEKFRAFEDYRILFYGLIIVFCLLFMRDGVFPFKYRIFKAKEAEKV